MPPDASRDAGDEDDVAPVAAEDITDPADPAGKPLSTGGWSESLIEIEGAVVVPPVESDFVQAAGVLHSDGRYCAEGALWRKWRPLTTEPAMPEGEVEDLPGRWLWGGVLWAHFGHFLAESTTRLWALDRLKDLDGILFIPKRPAVGDQVLGYQELFIRHMGTDLPVRVATAPLRVGHLSVPGQGFGLGEIVRGTDSYRAAVHDRFAKDIAPDGGEKLYISRSGLGVNKGGLIGEERLEAYLADEGYEIFQPEKHDFETQIARYKAARRVIAAEGSALHLFAMVARPEQDVAIIKRRRSSNSASDFIETHLASFAGRPPLAVAALRRFWMPEGVKAQRMGLGELDFPEVERVLAEAGYVGGTAGWTDMRRRDVLALMGRRSGRMRPAGQGGKRAGGAAEAPAADAD